MIEAAMTEASCNLSIFPGTQAADFISKIDDEGP